MLAPQRQTDLELGPIDERDIALRDLSEGEKKTSRLAADGVRGAPLKLTGFCEALPVIEPSSPTSLTTARTSVEGTGTNVSIKVRRAAEQAEERRTARLVLLHLIEGGELNEVVLNLGNRALVI